MKRSINDCEIDRTDLVVVKANLDSTAVLSYL